MSSSHILVVDDDETVRMILSAHCVGRGFRVSSAADGAAALEIIERQPVDVLLTDLEMPGMDGLALLQAVRERGMLTRCVVVTGYATIANLTACLRQGAFALVAKPLDGAGKLDGAIDQALAQLASWKQQMNDIVSRRHARSGS